MTGVALALAPGSAGDRGIDRIASEIGYGEEVASEVCCQPVTDLLCSHELQATNASVRGAY